MPPCNNPVNSFELVEGSKYEVYPKAEDGDELIFTGWFVGKQNIMDDEEQFVQSVIAIFRLDRAQQPGEAMGDPQLYKTVPLWGDGGERRGARYRYCLVGDQLDQLVGPMAKLNLNDSGHMAVEDGGRRKRRSKTRASQRTSLARSRSRRKSSQQRRAKSRRQRRM